MGAFKQLCIETKQDDNLVLFEDNTIQLFTYPEPEKLVPIKEILLEMRVAFEKNFTTNSSGEPFKLSPKQL